MNITIDKTRSTFTGRETITIEFIPENAAEELQCRFLQSTFTRLGLAVDPVARHITGFAISLNEALRPLLDQLAVIPPDWRKGH